MGRRGQLWEGADSDGEEGTVTGRRERDAEQGEQYSTPNG